MANGEDVRFQDMNGVDCDFEIEFEGCLHAYHAPVPRIRAQLLQADEHHIDAHGRLDDKDQGSRTKTIYTTYNIQQGTMNED